MKMIHFFLIASMLSIISKCSQSEQISGLKITELTREVDLTARYPVASSKLTLSNIGSSDITSFYYASPASLDKQTVLALLLIDQYETDGKKCEQQVSQTSILYEFPLQTALKAGQTLSVTVQETFKRRYESSPKAITLTQEQTVIYEDSKTFYTPYAVDKQSTSYTFNKILSYTEDSDSTKKGTKVTYGPIANQKAYTYKAISLHVENNEPLVILTNVTNLIEVSHWGNIAVESFSKLVNTGSSLAGEFGRVVYNKYNPNAGKNGLKQIDAQLPYHSWGVYYKDEIGNISTSHAWRSKSDKKVKIELEPRFPVLGGWKSNFWLGYNLNVSRYLYTENDKSTKYVLKQKFGMPLQNLIAEEYTLTVVLPEGASDISVDVPFAVDSQENGVYFGYLDTEGRPTVILQKNNLHSFHNQDFYVSYKLEEVNFFKKPLLIFGVFLAFFMSLIIIGRIEFASLKMKKE